MKTTINRLITVFAYFILIAYPSLALGAEQTNAPGGFRAYGALGLLIAYLTRKSAIGGWLLMYYISIYSGLLVVLVTTIVSFNNFNPNNWPDITRYVIVMSDITITIALLIATAIVSTALLMKKYRGRTLYSLLKQFLLASVIMSFASLGADFIYQQWDQTPLDVYSIIVDLIWYFYIVRSERVQHVFVMQDFKSWYIVSRPVKHPSVAKL